MSQLINDLRKSFSDEEYRYGYVESFLDTYIAAQIRTLREQRALTQSDLAQRLETKQAAISRLENVNYSAWNISTLKRLARAFRVRLRISFEEFAALPAEIEGFNRTNLQRRSFESDPVFGQRALALIVMPLAEGKPEQLKKTAVGILDEYMRTTSEREKKQPKFAETPKGEGAWNSLLYSSQGS